MRNTTTKKIHYHFQNQYFIILRDQFGYSWAGNFFTSLAKSEKFIRDYVNTNEQIKNSRNAGVKI